MRRASIASACWPHSWAARCHDEATKRIREAIDLCLEVEEPRRPSWTLPSLNAPEGGAYPDVGLEVFPPVLLGRPVRMQPLRMPTELVCDSGGSPAPCRAFIEAQ